MAGRDPESQRTEMIKVWCHGTLSSAGLVLIITTVIELDIFEYSMIYEKQ